MYALTLETRGHKVSQPGLRGHSHDPAQDLMKQFVLAQKLKNGLLWLESHDTKVAAMRASIQRDPHVDLVILDQFDGNRVVWADMEV